MCCTVMFMTPRAGGMNILPAIRSTGLGPKVVNDFLETKSENRTIRWNGRENDTLTAPDLQSLF